MWACKGWSGSLITGEQDNNPISTGAESPSDERCSRKVGTVWTGTYPPGIGFSLSSAGFASLLFSDPQKRAHWQLFGPNQGDRYIPALFAANASSTLQILQLCLCYIFPWLQTATILIGLADCFFNPFLFILFRFMMLILALEDSPNSNYNIKIHIR